MASANAELIADVYDAVNRGDTDAVLARSADDLVLDWSNSIGPAKGVYHGKEEVRAFIESFNEAFEQMTWESEELIELDGGRAIVVNHVRMRGRGSGVEVDAVGAQFWTIVDGEAQSIKLYQSKADALEAVGHDLGSTD